MNKVYPHQHFDKAFGVVAELVVMHFVLELKQKHMRTNELLLQTSIKRFVKYRCTVDRRNESGYFMTKYKQVLVHTLASCTVQFHGWNHSMRRFS